MELILIIGIVLVLIINDKNKEKNSILCYDTDTGRPIFTKDVIVKGYDTKTGLPLYEYKKKIIGYNTKTGYPIFEGDEQNNKNKISNTILMIAGAFLIIFASIIFLKSAWYDIPNILKSMVLIIIQIMFIFFSKICDKKLDLPKIARLFKYISYGFIPVVLLSGSYFEIFGEYFSKYSEGYPLYAGISFIITDIIYKIIAKDDKNLKTASYITEIIGLIYLGYMVNEQFNYSILFLTIQTIIIFILLQGNFLDKEAYKLTNDISTITISAFALLSHLVNNDILSYINLFILAIYSFINYKYFSEDKDKILFLIMFFITYIPTFRLIGSNIETTNFLYYVLSIPIIILLKGNDKSYKEAFRVLYALFSLVFIAVYSFVEYDNMMPILNMIGAIVFYIFSYKYLSEPIYKTCGYVSLTLIMVEIAKLSYLDELMKYIPLISSLIIVLIEFIFKNIKDKTSHTLIFLLLSLQTIICMNEITLLIPILLIIGYIYLNKLNEDLMFLPLFLSLSIFGIEEQVVVAIINILMITLCTIFSIKKKSFNMYTLFSLGYTEIMYTHFELDVSILFLINIVWGIIHILLKKESKFIYKLILTASSLGLYYKFLSFMEVEFTSAYILGLYIASMIVSRLIFNFEERKIDVLELVSFILITLLGIISSTDLANGLILIVILLALAIFSFAKKYKYYAYGSIIGLIGCILLQTISYWSLIPWYVYILVIGLILIGYAIYDENKKQKKKEQEKKEKDI